MDPLDSNSTMERKSNLQKLFDTVPAAYLVLSPELAIVAASDRYLRIIESSREKLIGRSLVSDFGQPQNQPWIGDARQLLTSLRRVRETGKRHRFFLREQPWNRSGLPESSKKIWRATTSPICDLGGNLSCLFHRLERVNDPRRSKRVRRFARRLIDMQEADRMRIARDLHDQMAQYLSAMTLELESVKTQQDPRVIADRVDHLQGLIHHVGEEVHRLTWDLRPAPIEEVGFRNSLVTCVEELSSYSSLQLHFYSNLTTEDRFDRTIETICYRTLQEALANAVKHAQATSLSVVITREEFGLHMIIEDDGIGFHTVERDSGSLQHDHIGLRGMRERLALIGGSLHVESTIGHGTSLFARIPLRTAGAS